MRPDVPVTVPQEFVRVAPLSGRGWPERMQYAIYIRSLSNVRGRSIFREGVAEMRFRWRSLSLCALFAAGLAACGNNSTTPNVGPGPNISQQGVVALPNLVPG